MEIRRILKPGGMLCLLWNERDESINWQKHLEEEIINHLYKEDDPRQQSKKWNESFEHFLGNYYGNLHNINYERSFIHAGGAEMIVGRIMSLSVVSRLPDSEKIEVENKVREWLKNRGDVDLENEEMIYRTELYYTQVIA